jgi:hypothetical protein
MLVACAGYAASTDGMQPSSPPAGVTERPYYSVYSPDWQVTLVTSDIRIRRRAKFQATLTIKNTRKEATWIPVDLAAFFQFGIRSVNVGPLPGHAVMTWLYEPPPAGATVRCRLFGAGETASFARTEVAPDHSGLFELVACISAIAPVRFEVMENVPKPTRSPPAGGGS